jgi:DNA-3-methyladenine glycosylase
MRKRSKFKSGAVLLRPFFERQTLIVAKDLLGKYLVREDETGLLRGRIVEVEAYVGPEDRASHASRGRTKRTDVMFGPPGIAYVYLIYGMHHCFNVVTERTGYPAAILVRAVEAEEANGSAKARPVLVDGPGRVCRWLHIDRCHDGLDVTTGQSLWMEDRGDRIADHRILCFPRIGVDYAGEWAAKPWRFRVEGFSSAAGLKPSRKSSR